MIVILHEGKPLATHSLTFSGGEVQFSIDPFDLQSPVFGMIAETRSARDLIELFMATDALRRTLKGIEPIIHLSIPYLPYARQDRVMMPGQSLSLKVVCDMINAQKYTSVSVWDVHSDVALALLDRVHNLEAYEFVKRFFHKETVLVAPDAGASKRVAKLAKELDAVYVRADKVRDVTTGAITDTAVYSEHVGDKDFLIVDDICDGGRTFIELAKKLRPLTNGRVLLYVTHGIFSKGMAVFDDHIDEIFCANIWETEETQARMRQTFKDGKSLTRLTKVLGDTLESQT